MRYAVALAVCLAVPALAGGSDAFPWGAGAFNSNYRPPGSTPAFAPVRNHALRSPHHVAPAVPYPYYYYSYYPYGSTYYGFQPVEPQPPTPAPERAPPQVVIFERPQAAAPEPVPAPQPQVVVVQVPVPTPAPEPAPPPPAVAAQPPAPKTPPRDVFHWVDADGVHHYSTRVPQGVKADKVR